jgi:hypothetical protein
MASGRRRQSLRHIAPPNVNDEPVSETTLVEMDQPSHHFHQNFFETACSMDDVQNDGARCPIAPFA